MHIIHGNTPRTQQAISEVRTAKMLLLALGKDTKRSTADALTKADGGKANHAMRSVLLNGTYRLAPKVEEMQLRKEDLHRKQRDTSTSVAFIREAHGATGQHRVAEFQAE